MNQYERAIGHAAIRTFGRIPNIIKTVEELAELQQALCRHMAKPDDAMTVENVHEEIADAQIMLGRLMMLFDPTEVQEWKDRKLEKTAVLLGVGVENGGDSERPENSTVCCFQRAGAEAGPGLEEPTGDALEEMRV